MPRATPRSRISTSWSGLAANSNGTIVPGRIIVAVEDDGLGSTINAFATNSATIQGHPGRRRRRGRGRRVLFPYARVRHHARDARVILVPGGAPILFDTSGTRLATPVVRQKPDFVGPDGVQQYVPRIHAGTRTSRPGRDGTC